MYSNNFLKGLNTIARMYEFQYFITKTVLRRTPPPTRLFLNPSISFCQSKDSKIALIRYNKLPC